MRYVDEFSDRSLAGDLAEAISRTATHPVTLMEVCGTHSMAIARYGIRDMLPGEIRLVSGPGCPVCVTPQSQIDRFIALGRRADTILATFGDMMRVPGSRTSLEVERAKGADIRVVYSPMDACAIARENPGRTVVFFGVGFETTAPAIALAVQEAAKSRLDNLLVLSALKLIPPAMQAIAFDRDVAIDGFICPGHVSTVIGSRAYEPIVAGSGVPCVVSGFEPLDILQSVLMLLRQIRDGRAEVENQFSRAVSVGGNLRAQECMRGVYDIVDSEWRGLGIIPNSGLRLKPEFSAYDASVLCEDVGESVASEWCECGEVLKGVKAPSQCRWFGMGCTPEHPLGPCMVSSEGACAAEYRYARVE